MGKEDVMSINVPNAAHRDEFNIFHASLIWSWAFVDGSKHFRSRRSFPFSSPLGCSTVEEKKAA
jgi:hypothetical protein